MADPGKMPGLSLDFAPNLSNQWVHRRETAEYNGHKSITPKPGRWGIVSLFCAVLALLGAPLVFGLLGIVAGAMAVWKGGVDGTFAVSASAVAGVVGYYLGAELIE